MSHDAYWWSGPIGGLGNRLIAIAAVKACTVDREVSFPWLNDPSCPGEYHDILDPIPNLNVGSRPSSHAVQLKTHNWEPLTIYRQLKKELRLSLSQSEFCLRFVDVLRHLPFKQGLKQKASQWRQAQSFEPIVGVHIRRTDRMAQHRKEFRRAIFRRQGISGELPLLLSAGYGIFPPGIISLYEDSVIGSQLKKIQRKNKKFAFSIFADNYRYVDGLKKRARWYGVQSAAYLAPALTATETFSAKAHQYRQTGLVDAVVDLLCLASCDAIIQNNRASTFSLAASIIGMTPIISAKTRYPFWHAIEGASEKALFGEGLSAQVIGRVP